MASKIQRPWRWAAPALTLGVLFGPGQARAEAEPLPAVAEEVPVEAGDTLLRIAARYDTTVERLLAFNPALDDPDRIRAGERLLLPVILGEPDEGEGPETCELIQMAEEEGIALPMPSAPDLDRDEAITLGPLIYANRVTEVFQREVRAVARQQGMDPDHLMAIMHYETGGSFSPSIRNRSTGATGLIQFLPSTARSLGTTVEALAAMTAVEQLRWVSRYFDHFRGRLVTIEDAYMAVLYPVAVGEPMDFVLFREGSTSYQRNPYLDSDEDGLVTKGEVGETIRQVLERGQASLSGQERSG